MSRQLRMPEQMLRRSVQLLVGLFLGGIGIALVVLAAFGASPWDVLSLGIINNIDLSFGLVTVLLSGVVLLLWIPLREKPGVGTVLNALIVGPSADFGLHVIPETSVFWVQAAYLAAGLLLFALGTGMYIGVGWGSGPRDGLMTGLHRKFGMPIWVARTSLEASVVSIGWLLGGVVGVGTLLFAVLIGPLCQFFIRVCRVPLKRTKHEEIVAQPSR